MGSSILCMVSIHISWEWKSKCQTGKEFFSIASLTMDSYPEYMWRTSTNQVEKDNKMSGYQKKDWQKMLNTSQKWMPKVQKHWVSFQPH